MKYINCKCGNKIYITGDKIMCEACGRKYRRKLKEDVDDFNTRWDKEFPDDGADILSPNEAKSLLHRMADFK